MSIAISILLILVSLFLIVTVLLQSSDDNGISAISGQAANLLGKGKAKDAEAKLALGTKIAAIAFVVLSLVMLFVK